MSETPLYALGVVAAADAVRAGKVTPRELAEAVLARLEAVEPQIEAFVHVDRDAVLAQADELTAEAARGAFRGPLHGVPIAIKDIFDLTGVPTKRGSELFTDAPAATSDAVSVARLRAAGALFIGKTVTHELACGVYSVPTRNPWDLTRCCGGSSGGTGAAVAAGAAMAGTGSDTGGSIRIPATVCGLVGIKPTYDLVSREGVAELAWSLDHIGPLARSVDDAALVFDVLVEPSRRPAGASYFPVFDANLAETTIGIPADGILARATPAVTAAFADACKVLEAAGATLVSISLPELEDTLEAEFGIVMAEAAEYYADDIRERSELIGEGIRGLFQDGLALPAIDLAHAHRLRAGIARALDNAFFEHGLDAIASPTLPLQAWRHEDETVELPGGPVGIVEAAVGTTGPFNLSGLPVVNVPTALPADGLPASIQFAGRQYADATVLVIARAYESLRDSAALDAAAPLLKSTFTTA